MKTPLSIGVLSFGVLVFSCGLSTRAAEQLISPSPSGGVTLATTPAHNHVAHTNDYNTSTTVKSVEDEQPFSVTLESPVDQSVELGGTAVFSIYCNWPDAVFQWLFQCERIPNATNSSLSVSKLRFEDAGYYTCVVYRGFDFELSKPMQLMVFQRKGDDIIVAAKAPPGLGGMWDAPVKVEKKTALLEKVNPTRFENAVAMPAGGAGIAGIASLGSSLMNLSQLTLFMQSKLTNSTAGPTIVSVTGAGCPRPYQGYVRFTAGWYPNSAAATWSVAGTGGTSTYSAITFDDTTRQACFPGNIFNLNPYAPLKVKPHRFVCFFSTPPSSTTTYYIQLTGFL